jgi:hypothetical protein
MAGRDIGFQQAPEKLKGRLANDVVIKRELDWQYRQFSRTRPERFKRSAHVWSCGLNCDTKRASTQQTCTTPCQLFHQERTVNLLDSLAIAHQ